jgi:hypothetical protein
MNKENRIVYEDVRKQLRKHTLQLTQVVIITISNADDYSFYSNFESNIIIVNEVIKFLKVDIWNILSNYAKKLLLLIDDDAQLRSIILSDSNQNEFVYSMLMSLFHRLKLLKHSSMLLKTQYRMLNVIENMISTFFYDQRLKNDHETNLILRFISQTIIEYVNRRWSIQSFMILYDVFEQTNKNSTKSSFNLMNVFAIMRLTINLIKERVMKFVDFVILTFYKVQMKVYRQIIRNLSLIEFRMIDIQVKTMNSMQKSQISVIIMNVMICNKIDFLRLRNRVNVACFRVMNELFVVSDVISIMSEKIFHRRHIDNVFTFMIERSIKIRVKDLKSSSYVSTILSRRDMKDQKLDKKKNVEKWIDTSIKIEEMSFEIDASWNTRIFEHETHDNSIEVWKETTKYDAKSANFSSKSNDW